MKIERGVEKEKEIRCGRRGRGGGGVSTVVDGKEETRIKGGGGRSVGRIKKTTSIK